MRSIWMGGACLLLALGSAVLWCSLPEAPNETSVVRGSDSGSPRAEPEATIDASADDDRELASNEPEAETRVEAPLPSTASSEPSSSTRPTSEFRGRLIQRSDKSPLADLALELQDAADRKFLVTSGADGRFAAPSPLALGLVKVRVLDHPDRKASVWTKSFEPTEWESHEIELEFQPGPTFRLAITPASIPVRELEARLVTDRDKDKPWMVEFDPIHEGNPPWVRFSSHISGPHGEHQLEVRSRDGLLFGAVAVSRGWGVEPSVLSIDLESRAAIRGRVVSTDGTALAKVKVNLRVRSATQFVPPPDAITDADGAFRFDVLPMGIATLSASLFRFEPVDGELVTLAPGRSAEPAITLRRLPSAGSIRARITSATGRYDAPSQMALSRFRDNKNGEVVETVDVEWIEASGRRTGVGEFRDIPAGDYRVIGFTKGVWSELKPNWEPRRVDVSPPSELEFVVRDDVARADLVVRAHDADTGTAIVGFDSLLALGAKGQFAYGFGAEAEQPLLRGVPLTESFQWRVDKLGYKGISGTERDFTLEEIHDGRTHRIAEVALRPGWADVVRVTERKTKTPLQGARVLVDGDFAGVTDEAGLLTLVRAAAPRVIRVEVDGWRPEDVHSPRTARARNSLWIEFELTRQSARR